MVYPPMPLNNIKNKNTNFPPMPLIVFKVYSLMPGQSLLVSTWNLKEKKSWQTVLLWMDYGFVNI